MLVALVLFLASTGTFPLSVEAPRLPWTQQNAASGTGMPGEWTSGAARVHEAAAVQAAVVPATMRSFRGVIVPMAAPRRPPRSTVVTYVVQQGDNIVRIAHEFGLEVSTLLWANPALEDDPDLLTIGQELMILPVDGTLYKVARGDSVEAIAAKHKVEASAILEYPANGLGGSDALSVGQELVIPGGIKPAVPKPVPTARPAAVVAAPAAPPAPDAVPAASGSLGWPIQGTLSQGYWVAGYASHRAIDIAAPSGTPIYAADAGYVSHVQWNVWPYGTMVMITHSNGLETLYAHMSSVSVSVGQSVSKGEQIGGCGSTGRSTGPHLHFEVRRGGANLNPLSHLP